MVKLKGPFANKLFSIEGLGSWDSLIDNLIALSKDASGEAQCDRACIIGLDGGASWTTKHLPQSLKLSLHEAQNIARAFKDDVLDSFQSNGVFAEGIKYLFVKQDNENFMLKKKDHGALTIRASKTVIVIGHCKEGGHRGNVNRGVIVIAEYLESVNM